MQILLILACAMMHYKRQRAKFVTVILDLQYGNSTTNASHKSFYSSYIKLFFLQFLEGI